MPQARLNVRWALRAYSYAITDASLTSFTRTKLLKVLKGVPFVQYRDKNSCSETRLRQARLLKRSCLMTKTKLIINDDWILARRIQADGIHLGCKDTSIQQVRHRLSRQMTIGCSCYDSIRLAKKQLLLGADYVAFGALFPSKTKTNAPRASMKRLSLGKSMTEAFCVGIGGVDAVRLQSVIRQGASYGAMVNAFWK